MLAQPGSAPTSFAPPSPPRSMRGSRAMADNAALAQAAGLERAWQDHRADVEEAIALAARFRGAFTRPAEPGAEPTPPYAAPVTQ
jgi:hypothetical protein